MFSISTLSLHTNTQMNTSKLFTSDTETFDQVISSHVFSYGMIRGFVFVVFCLVYPNIIEIIVWQSAVSKSPDLQVFMKVKMCHTRQTVMIEA